MSERAREGGREVFTVAQLSRMESTQLGGIYSSSALKNGKYVCKPKLMTKLF